MHRLRLFLSALKPTRLGVLFAVLAGLGVGFWQWGQPPRPRVVLEDLDYGLQVYFSPDGRTVATAEGVQVHTSVFDWFLTLWDVDSGQKKTKFLLARDRPANVVFSPDGRTVACHLWEKIGVWDIASPAKPIIYDSKWLSTLVYSPEGKLLALRPSYELWDVAKNKVVKKLVLEGEQGFSELRVLGKNGIVKIWD